MRKRMPADQLLTRKRQPLHPAALRLMHWSNALAVVVMVLSGWQIYNNVPIIKGLEFPRALTLSGDARITFDKWQDSGMAIALQWHFAAMWLLVANGFCYLVYVLASGRWRRMLLPLSLRGALHEIGDALRFKLKHDDVTVYNNVQRLMYLGVVATLIVTSFAGLAIWKPNSFDELASLFGGFQGARIVHFICMWLIVGFTLVHVALALLVPRTLLAMVTGGERVPVGKVRAP